MPFSITEQAKADMIALYVDGAEKHGVDRAESYYAGLITQFKQIAQMPELYHERRELTPPIRVCPYGSHIIIYTVSGDGSVLIVRVRHGREDWQ